MVASLPTDATFATAHVVSSTEWSQILNAIKGLSNIATANFYGTMSVSTASATYVNVTGASLTGFTKYLGSSNLLAFLAISSRCTTTANHPVNYGINDGTTDWQMMTGWETTVNKHNTYIAWRTLTGLSSGGPYTFQARVKADGTNTIAIDGNDCGFIIVAELPT